MMSILVITLITNRVSQWACQYNDIVYIVIII